MSARRPFFAHITLWDGTPETMEPLTMCGKSRPKSIVPRGVVTRFACGRCVALALEQSDQVVESARKLRDKNRDMNRRLNEVATALTRPGASRPLAEHGVKP